MTQKGPRARLCAGEARLCLLEVGDLREPGCLELGWLVAGWLLAAAASDGRVGVSSL